MVKVNPIRSTTLTFTYITHTMLPLQLLSKAFLKTAQKNEQRKVFSLSSHIWEIWSSLWRELGFMRLVGKHTVVELWQSSQEFPWVKVQNYMGVNEAERDMLTVALETRKLLDTTGAEFQTKQIQETRTWTATQSALI